VQCTTLIPNASNFIRYPPDIGAVDGLMIRPLPVEFPLFFTNRENLGGVFFSVSALMRKYRSME
jgi:hypothetical protein